MYLEIQNSVKLDEQTKTSITDLDKIINKVEEAEMWRDFTKSHITGICHMLSKYFNKIKINIKIE